MRQRPANFNNRSIRLGVQAALFVCMTLGAMTPAAIAQADKPFPDEWFFSGVDRSVELRDLEGKPATEIDVMQWIGEETSLRKLRGKVVVLDFWATWCGPCMAAIPENVELYDEYKKDGLEIIGIHDTNRGWDKAADVVRDKGINYPIAKDSTGGISAKAYNLSFWPTYVVIDREGIVRGAGLIPGHVRDAVKQLLAEPYDGPGAGTASDAAAPGGFLDEWYYGGEKRPAAFRAIEGQPATAIEVTDWAPEQPKPRAWDRKVMVMQFVRPEFAFSMTQIEQIRDVVKKFTAQGVVFVAVCDARSDWERMLQEIESRKITWTVVHDAPLPEDQTGGGVTTKAYGVMFGPATVVVDRAGVVRAAGLRTQRLEVVINTLMAERLPAQPVTTENTKSESNIDKQGSDH